MSTKPVSPSAIEQVAKSLFRHDQRAKNFWVQIATGFAGLIDSSPALMCVAKNAPVTAPAACAGRSTLALFRHGVELFRASTEADSVRLYAISRPGDICTHAMRGGDGSVYYGAFMVASIPSPRRQLALIFGFRPMAAEDDPLMKANAARRTSQYK